MSAIVCHDGLFIGVERSAGLNRAQWLRNACSDAMRLHAYFKTADESGRWRSICKGPRPPKRFELLSAVQAFARGTPEGSAGILTFSGHAVLTDTGLVLKAFDTYDGFPNDTGLTLRRLLGPLKEQASRGKCFFVVLDCCREGLKEAAADDIPANVCILYACEQGERALETDDDGGVLTRSIIEALRNISEETGGRHCSVRALCTRLGRQLYRWRPALALQHELCGSGVDRILLPIVRQADASPGPVEGLAVGVLRYAFGSREAHAHGLAALVGAVFSWYGIPYDSVSGQTFVREHFVIPQSGERLGFDITLPKGSSRWATSEFLSHLLMVPIDGVDALIMTWNRDIDFAEIKPLQKVVQGEWSRGALSEHRLTWRNVRHGREYRGVATLSRESAGMQLNLGCETVDCYEMPLHNLMPTISDMFDLFRSVV